MSPRTDGTAGWGTGPERWVPWLLGAFGLVWTLVLALWDGGRLVMTPFREGQTGLTAWAMLEQGLSLSGAELPVFGAPWRAPFELPLFQALVAAVAGVTGSDVLAVGRILSLLSLGAAALLASCWLGQLGASPLARRLAPAALFAAPLLLGFGWAFLIESFVLALTLAALVGLTSWLQRPRLAVLAGAVALSALAAAVKPTTWFGGAVVLGLLTAAHLLGALRAGRQPGRLAWTALGAAVWAGAGLAAALAWTHFGDAVKADNPLAAQTTSAALASWNYGTLDQKLSPAVWLAIGLRNLLLLLGPVGLAAPLLILLAWVRRPPAGPGRPVAGDRASPARALGGEGFILLALLAGYLAAPLVFTNLHFRHNYYAYANGPFLILATVLALDRLGRHGGVRLARWSALLLALSGPATTVAFTVALRVIRQPAEERTIQLLRSIPSPGAIATVGLGWSAHVPFEARRRALMAPDEPDQVASLTELNRGVPYVALVWSGTTPTDATRGLAAGLGLEGGEETEVWPGRWVRLAPGVPRPVVDPAGDSALRWLEEARAWARSGPRAGPGGVWWRGPSATGAGWLGWELGVRRGDEFFHLRLHDGVVVRLTRFFSTLPPSPEPAPAPP